MSNLHSLQISVQNSNTGLFLKNLLEDKVFLHSNIDTVALPFEEGVATFKNLMLLEKGLNSVGYSIFNEMEKLLFSLKSEQVLELADYLSKNTLKLETKTMVGLFKNVEMNIKEKEFLTLLKAHYDILSSLSLSKEDGGQTSLFKTFLSNFLNLEQIEEKDLLELASEKETKKSLVNYKQISFLDLEQTSQYLKNLLCGNVTLSLNKILDLEEILNYFNFKSVVLFLGSLYQDYENKVNKTFVLNYLFNAYYEKESTGIDVVNGTLAKTVVVSLLGNATMTDYLRFFVGIPLFVESNKSDIKNSDSYVNDYLQAIALTKGKYHFAMNKALKKEALNLALTLFNHQLSENKEINQFILDDMFMHRNIWLSFFNYFSLGNNKKLNSDLADLIQKLYKNDKGLAYNSKVEKAILNKDLEKSLKELVKKPGVFVKRISSLLKLDGEKTLTAFKDKVVKKVSNKVLLQLLTYSKHEEENAGYIVMKAKRSPFYVNKDKIGKKKEVDSKYLRSLQAIIFNELVSRYSSLETLGNVYLDNSISGLNLSFNQTKSNATKNVAFGSKIKVQDLLVADQKVEDLTKLRAFIYWKHCSDLDLSMLFYNDRFELKETINFRKLENEFCTHSGDVRSAPNGGAEFIDVDLEKVKEKGFRYGLMFVNNYSGSNFSTMEECFAGISLVDEQAEDKKELQTRNVLFKSDLKTNNVGNICYLYDFEENKIIWLDIGCDDIPTSTSLINLYDILVNNIVSNNIQTVDTFKSHIQNAITLAFKGQFASFEDLMFIHTFARGHFVEELEEADTIICLDGNCAKVQQRLELVEKHNQAVKKQAENMDEEVNETHLLKKPRIISALDFSKELLEFL